MVIAEEFDVARTVARGAERPRRAGRSSWLWGAAACGLIAAGVVLAPENGPSIGVVDEIGEPRLAWQATLATEVPDADAPPGGPLAPSRRVAVIDGVAVVATDDLLAGYALEGGEPLWELAQPGRFCTLLSAILCVLDPGGTDARVQHVDALTGAVDDDALAGAVTAAPAPEGTVALIDDGTATLAVRLDEDGTERWRTAVIDRSLVLDRAIDMAVVGAHVYVAGSPGSAVLDLATGELVPDAVTVVPGSDHAFRSGYRSSAWELADGTVVALPANAIPLEVDDDPRSTLDVVRTSRGRFVVDAAGRPIFELEQDRTALGRLDGHLITAFGFGGEITSHDLATGVEVAHIPGWARCPCVGAGSTFVITTTDGTLNAVDVRTGTLLWTAPLGDLSAHDAVALDARGALVLDDDRLTFLRWSD